MHFDRKVGIASASNNIKRDSLPSLQKSSRRFSTVKAGAVFPSVQTIINELQNCSQYTVPDCLRALYLIPPVLTNLQKNPFGIVEFTPQAYLQSDLNMFFANFSKNQRQKTPIEDDIDGGFQQHNVDAPDYNIEPDLDLEYGMTLVNPISTTLYQVGDIDESATTSFNNFLDAIDGSYCTFEGGDDRSEDAIFPDPYGPDPGYAYEGPENCGGFAATKVISTSYGYNEHDLSPFYTARQCAEYAKLGLMGVSVLYSSGDDGVAGFGGQCIDPVTGAYNDGNSGRFNPSFPGTVSCALFIFSTSSFPQYLASLKNLIIALHNSASRPIFL